MGRISNTVTLEDSGVIPGTYLNANIVVNEKGIITSATTGGSGGGGAGSLGLNDLLDVMASGPADCSIIKYNSTTAMWEQKLHVLDELFDVQITGSAASGEVLSYNGSTWTNTNLSGAGILTVGQIGVDVQAWSQRLDGLGAMDNLTGYVIQTGDDTFVKRSIMISPGSGLTIVDGDGVAGPTMIGVDIISSPREDVLDSACDAILFFDDSANAVRHTTMDIILGSAPVIDAMNVGVGAGVYKQLANQRLELRSIQAGTTSIMITNTGDEIVFELSKNLEDLAGLSPVDCGFLIGDSTGCWTVQTDQDARDCLGLGSIALADAGDYLLITGGTMLGDINMGANFITNMRDPINGQDAATKAYVDAVAGTGGGGSIGPLIAGNGLLLSGNTLETQSLDGSITVNADDIQINTAFTDARYYTQADLNDVTPGSEGADLIGTDPKPNLNNSDTVEEALSYVNNNWPFAVARYSQDITGIWNLDVGAPNIRVNTRNDVEIAQFETASDVAIYKDLLLPPDFIASRPLHLYTAFAKDSSTTDDAIIALAWQTQRAPGFSADDLRVFSTPTTDIIVLDWIIPGGTFQPLDTITLRLSRLGTNAADNHSGYMDFFSSYLIQD